MNNDFLWLEEKLKTHFPDGIISINDMTGTKDHLEIHIKSDRFKSLRLIQQHQLVMDALKEDLKARIHAVKLNTKSLT